MCGEVSGVLQGWKGVEECAARSLRFYWGQDCERVFWGRSVPGGALGFAGRKGIKKSAKRFLGKSEFNPTSTQSERKQRILI